MEPACSNWWTCRSSCDRSRRVLWPRQMNIECPSVRPVMFGPMTPACSAAARGPAPSGTGRRSTISMHTRSGSATPTDRAMSCSNGVSDSPTSAARAARASAHAIAPGRSMGSSCRRFIVEPLCCKSVQYSLSRREYRRNRNARARWLPLPNLQLRWLLPDRRDTARPLALRDVVLPLRRMPGDVLQPADLQLQGRQAQTKVNYLEPRCRTPRKTEPVLHGPSQAV